MARTTIISSGSFGYGGFLSLPGQTELRNTQKMRAQRPEYMSEEEISVLALEIMKDLRRVSTKTNIDTIGGISNKTIYNIVPFQANDSLHGIPPIPTPKTNNYDSVRHKKRGISNTKKLETNSNSLNSGDTIETIPSIQSISPKSSISRLTPSDISINITGYSPYSSKFSQTTSISVSPIYSPRKYIPPLAPMPPSVAMTSCLSQKRRKKTPTQTATSRPIISNRYNATYKRKKKKTKEKMVQLRRSDELPKVRPISRSGLKSMSNYKSDALQQIISNHNYNHMHARQRRPKPLPFFVERQSIQNNKEYGKSAPIPFGVRGVVSETESDYTSPISPMYKANIRFLYNSESNKKKSKKKKKKKSKKGTPVPHVRNDGKYKIKSNNIQCNNEYMVECEDGFLFVNHVSSY